MTQQLLFTKEAKPHLVTIDGKRYIYQGGYNNVETFIRMDDGREFCLRWKKFKNFLAIGRAKFDDRAFQARWWF